MPTREPPKKPHAAKITPSPAQNKLSLHELKLTDPEHMKILARLVSDGSAVEQRIDVLNHILEEGKIPTSPEFKIANKILASALDNDPDIKIRLLAAKRLGTRDIPKLAGILSTPKNQETRRIFLKEIHSDKSQLPFLKKLLKAMPVQALIYDILSEKITPEERSTLTEELSGRKEEIRQALPSFNTTNQRILKNAFKL